MKTLNFLGATLALALGLLTTSGGAAHTLAAVSSQAPSEGAWPVHLQAPQAGPIIIDHTTTDISKIPDYWIEQAKALLRASYGHTSHGSQLVSGISIFGTLNSLYDYNTDGAIEAGVFSLDDYTPSGDLGNPDRVSWASRTRTYLDSSMPPGNNRNLVMWSWCGQADTSNPSDIVTYLDLMTELEDDYPAVKFVYMTGHLAGTGPSGDLYQRNNQIRDYVQQNNKVLFDFADIESYDPDGNYYPDESDGCSWCTTWCNDPAHATECNLADTLGLNGCAHSHNFNCYRKGQAVWWLLARLAGWSGPEGTPLSISKSVALTHDPAWPGDPITYTIVVRNSTVTDTTDVRITDTLPSGVIGTNLDTTRTVTGNSAVTITIPATVASDVSSGAVITNTAFFTHTTGGDYARAVFHITTLLPDFSTSAKGVNASSVQVDSLVTFTLAFTNTGLASATVRYTDTLPAQVDWVSGALSGAMSVDDGASAWRVIVARVKRDAVHGMAFSNTVAVDDGVHAVFNLASPDVMVLAPDMTHSTRTVNKSLFEPGERITYTLALSNSGGVDTTARYTVTLPGEVISPSGDLSGTMFVGAGSAVLPVVMTGQVRDDLTDGTTLWARVDINDGYHAVYTLNFPVAAINAFYTYLPVVIKP
jgi:uncharacterized repeat protein (TIGR01451 family)